MDLPEPDRKACGCREPGQLCDLQVLVDEAAEPVSSEHADARFGTWRGVACGRSLIQGSVWAVGVMKSVRGAVPVFRPVRFLGPLPEPAGRLSPQRALRRSQVGPVVGYAAAGQGAEMAAPCGVPELGHGVDQR
jgi:hypothetical protein